MIMNIQKSLMAMAMTAAWAMAADSSDWNLLKRIAPSQEIVVVKTDMKRITGQFAHVSETGLEVSTGAETIKVERGEVMRVTTLGGRGRKMTRGAIIGAAVGFAAGLGMTLASGGADGLGLIVTGGNTALGAAIGLGVGAVIPAGATVYRRPGPVANQAAASKAGI